MKGAALFLKEVQQKQVGHHEDEEMRVDVDFSEKTIQMYENYTQSVFDYCKEQFEIGGCDLNALSDLDLSAATENIAGFLITGNLRYAHQCH